MESLLTPLRACRLCPRECGVDRLAGQIGWCGAGRLARVARAALHHWEEPVISGSRGSGAVFFSRCNLRCLYCQNHEISWGGWGRELTTAQLAEVFLGLQGQGAHNINLVSPTPYIPQIAAALDLARQSGLMLPVVYNTNAYESLQALGVLTGRVQVFLPDFKYALEYLGVDYSGVAGYPAAAGNTLRVMRRLAPRDRFDRDGLLVEGLLVRHLVLPGHPANTGRVLRWLAKNLGRQTYVSLMAQYTPVFRAEGHPTIGRCLQAAEYEWALRCLEEAGLENGFCQEIGSADSSFIPPFDLTGLPRSE